MHTRMNMMVGDPAHLGEATRYLEGTVRPHVEAQHGNRGVACLVNEDLGVCLVASYWDSLDSMTAISRYARPAASALTPQTPAGPANPPAAATASSQTPRAATGQFSCTMLVLR